MRKNKPRAMPSATGRFINPLRLARAGAGLRQADLGRLSGCSGNVISRSELGLRRPDLDLARRIAGSLGIDVESIFPGLEAPAAAPVPEEGDDERAGR